MVRRRWCLVVQRKERQERAGQKRNAGFQKGGFRPHQPDKGAGKDDTQNKGKGKDQKGKSKEALFLNLDTQPLKNPMKKDMAIVRSRTTGLPAIGLTILGLKLLDGLERELILRRWWQPLSTLPTIQHTWFWTLAAHGRLDQERQSEDSTSMHGMMALRQEFRRCIKTFCVRQLRDRSLHGQLRYPLSSSTAMFYQG